MKRNNGNAVDTATGSTSGTGNNANGNTNKTTLVSTTFEQLKRTVVLEYLENRNPNEKINPNKIEREILQAQEDAINLVNMMRPRGSKWKVPNRLEPRQIAVIISYLHSITCIVSSESSLHAEMGILTMYQESGKHEGLYLADSLVFEMLFRQYCESLKMNEVKEIEFALRTLVPRKECCKNEHLVAVNNGVFNYKTKQLLPFSPDYIFTSKCKADYNPNATNVVIYNHADNTTWDVESWMSELSDDPAVVELLWETIGACVRPLVHWDKSAWFYSNQGSNGKGTLCQLMRNLLGEGSYTTIDVDTLGKDFALEPLIGANAVIVDENNVGMYIDKAAVLKAIITQDVIQINRKFKMPIAYRFQGFMVQCVNEMPRVKDKSNSLLRRLVIIPFTKCFTGQERKYIKSDYLARREVLEYVLYRVLNMNYDELSSPSACLDMLSEYKEYNDPIQQFVVDVIENATWNLLPFTFLYDLYKSWHVRNNPSGRLEGRNTFIEHLLQVIVTHPDWECTDKKAKHRTGSYIVRNEPLATEYDLNKWENYKNIGLFHRGLLRVTNNASQTGNLTAQGTTI